MANVWLTPEKQATTNVELLPEDAEWLAEQLERISDPSDTPAAEAPRSEEDRVHEGLDLIVGTVEALAGMRTGDDKVWGSMVKQALRRVKPGFSESYYGFRSFNQMLEEAQSRGLVTLERDDKSGGYAVRLSRTAE